MGEVGRGLYSLPTGEGLGRGFFGGEAVVKR